MQYGPFGPGIFLQYLVLQYARRTHARISSGWHACMHERTGIHEPGCMLLRSYGTRSPLQDLTRIIDFTFRFPMPH
jgi:hypothetical protein